MLNFFTISGDTREGCPANCINYFDGCNWCDCDPETGLARCTQRACSDLEIEEPFCDECESNFVWNDCGSQCWTEQDCENPNGVLCVDVCVPQCECPSDKPLYDAVDDECITENECGLSKCPEYCIGEYYDGCNTCDCNSITGYAENCDEIDCVTSGPPECKQCVNNLEWTFCGDACWKEYTCDNPNGPDGCIEICSIGCQCPSNKPIWDEDNEKCISESACNGHSNGGNNGNKGSKSGSNSRDSSSSRGSSSSQSNGRSRSSSD